MFPGYKSHLSASPHPVITSIFKMWKTPVEIEQPPLTCMPPGSYKVVLDPCFKWVWWTRLSGPPTWYRFHPAGPQWKTPDARFHSYLRPDPSASVKYRLQWQDGGNLKCPWEWVGEGPGVMHALWEDETFCKQAQRYPPPHLPEAAAVKHTHFHITIHCWHLLKPLSTQELVECSEQPNREVYQTKGNKMMKYSLCRLPALL